MCLYFIIPTRVQGPYIFITNVYCKKFNFATFLFISRVCSLIWILNSWGSVKINLDNFFYMLWYKFKLKYNRIKWLIKDDFKLTFGKIEKIFFSLQSLNSAIFCVVVHLYGLLKPTISPKCLYKMVQEWSEIEIWSLSFFRPMFQSLWSLVKHQSERGEEDRKRKNPFKPIHKIYSGYAEAVMWLCIT